MTCVTDDTSTAKEGLTYLLTFRTRIAQIHPFMLARLFALTLTKYKLSLNHTSLPLNVLCISFLLRKFDTVRSYISTTIL